jgi:predicted DsbA family dithiol-disulfide isomerase
MKPTIKIDFVSDVACPWCAVGLGELQKALEQIGDRATIELHFKPFELNPQMPVGGQDAVEHLTQKYGLSEEQVQANQAQIRTRAAEAGFQFHPDGRKRVYNTFNCHRLLHWAEKEYGRDAQLQLKRELLNTYFCLAVNLDEQENLLNAVARAGLDSVKAKLVLDQNAFAQEVRAAESFYTQAGISSVPSVILNEQHLIQGAQPASVFISALEQLIDEQGK